MGSIRNTMAFGQGFPPARLVVEELFLVVPITASFLQSALSDA